MAVRGIATPQLRLASMLAWANMPILSEGWLVRVILTCPSWVVRSICGETSLTRPTTSGALSRLMRTVAPGLSFIMWTAGTSASRSMSLLTAIRNIGNPGSLLIDPDHRFPARHDKAGDPYQVGEAGIGGFRHDDQSGAGRLLLFRGRAVLEPVPGTAQHCETGHRQYRLEIVGKHHRAINPALGFETVISGTMQKHRTRNPRLPVAQLRIRGPYPGMTESMTEKSAPQRRGTHFACKTLPRPSIFTSRRWPCFPCLRPA